MDKSIFKNNIGPEFWIKQNEESLTKLFSSKFEFSEKLIKYQDDALPDMYDLNYFEYDDLPSEAEIEAAINFQKNKGDKFIKFESRKQLPEDIVQKFRFDAWAELCMQLKTGNPSLWTKNTNLQFKDLRRDDIADDLIDFEIKNYGPVYGEDFARRKMEHWLKKAKETDALNFYAAYLDGKIVGSLYSYKYKDYTCMDGLHVLEAYRKQYVATSLIAYCIKDNNGEIFLHAEADDTPKDMYQKLGFETVSVKYNNAKKW